jgi:hypothetical protein
MNYELERGVIFENVEKFTDFLNENLREEYTHEDWTHYLEAYLRELSDGSDATGKTDYELGPTETRLHIPETIDFQKVYVYLVYLNSNNYCVCCCHNDFEWNTLANLSKFDILPETLDYITKVFKETAKFDKRPSENLVMDYDNEVLDELKKAIEDNEDDEDCIIIYTF